MTISKRFSIAPKASLMAIGFGFLLTLDIILLLNLRERGLPIGLVFGLAVACLLSVGMIASLKRWLRPISQNTGSIIRFRWRRSPAWSYTQAISKKYPRLSQWLADRTAYDRPDGMILTGGVVIAAALTLAFAALAKDVLLRDEIVDIDQHLIHTLYDMRTPLQTVFFKFMTELAGFESMVVFILVLAVASWRRKALPLLFGAALAVAVIMTQGLKIIFGRLRPDEALRLVVENGFSFPSGHTFVATIMYGLTGYVLWRTAHSSVSRFIAAAASVTTIVLIGCSRNYLGVHFPSDVMASLLFGSAFLVLFITAIEINERYRLRPKFLLARLDRRSLTLTLVATILASSVLTVIQ